MELQPNFPPPEHFLVKILQEACGIPPKTPLARYRATNPALPLAPEYNTEAGVAVLRAAELLLSEARGYTGFESSSSLPAERMGTLLRVLLEHVDDLPTASTSSDWLAHLYQLSGVWSAGALQACLASMLRSATEGLTRRNPEKSSGLVARLQLRLYVVDTDFVLMLTLQEGTRLRQREYSPSRNLESFEGLPAVRMVQGFKQLREWGTALATQMLQDYAEGKLFSEGLETQQSQAVRVAEIIAESLSPAERDALRNNIGLLVEKL